MYVTRIGLLSSFSLTSALCASLQVRSKPPPGEAGAMHSGRLGSSAASSWPANSMQPAARANLRNERVMVISDVGVMSGYCQELLTRERRCISPAGVLHRHHGLNIWSDTSHCAGARPHP